MYEYGQQRKSMGARIVHEANTAETAETYVLETFYEENQSYHCVWRLLTDEEYCACSRALKSGEIPLYVKEMVENPSQFRVSLDSSCVQDFRWIVGETSFYFFVNPYNRLYNSFNYYSELPMFQRETPGYPRNLSVAWRYKDKEIVIRDSECEGGVSNGLNSALPSPDGKYVLVIYSEGTTNELYKTSRNAVIYHADGTVHKHLEMPELSSPWLIFSNPKGPYNCIDCFYNASYVSRFSCRVQVNVEYFFCWWESRELNFETGELGKMREYGRL